MSYHNRALRKEQRKSDFNGVWSQSRLPFFFCACCSLMLKQFKQLFLVHVWETTVDGWMHKFSNVHITSHLFHYLRNCKTYGKGVLGRNVCFNFSLQLLFVTFFLCGRYLASCAWDMLWNARRASCKVTVKIVWSE
jgi:hypothetical protein